MGPAGCCYPSHHPWPLGARAWVWILLFSDDFNITATGSNFAVMLLCVAWVLVLHGVPLAWAKAIDRFTYTWIGYEISLKEWSLGVSSRRAEWMMSWMKRALKKGKVNVKEHREAIGRMVFVLVPWCGTAHFSHLCSPSSRYTRTPALPHCRFMYGLY